MRHWSRSARAGCRWQRDGRREQRDGRGEQRDGLGDQTAAAVRGDVTGAVTQLGAGGSGDVEGRCRWLPVAATRPGRASVRPDSRALIDRGKFPLEISGATAAKPQCPLRRCWVASVSRSGTRNRAVLPFSPREARCRDDALPCHFALPSCLLPPKSSGWHGGSSPRVIRPSSGRGGRRCDRPLHPTRVNRRRPVVNS